MATRRKSVTNRSGHGNARRKSGSARTANQKRADKRRRNR